MSSIKEKIIEKHSTGHKRKRFKKNYIFQTFELQRPNQKNFKI